MAAFKLLKVSFELFQSYSENFNFIYSSSIKFTLQLIDIISKFATCRQLIMPPRAVQNVQNQQAAQHVQDIQALIEELVQDPKSWTRKRLVKNPDGSWTRIGRLRRVSYTD